ncbi:hypothetical protein [Chitinophaga sp.]|uniref:hypothetical protein n=1 Tax=Chitinophaga sp. TaxID=1869181 RepID=UPI0031E0F66E
MVGSIMPLPVDTLKWDYDTMKNFHLKVTSLPVDQLFVEDSYKLAHEILHLFEFPSGVTISLDKDDIESACKIVLLKMEVEINDNPVSQFLEEVAGFYQLPVVFLKKLESKVRVHLSQVVHLIKGYESERVIIDYLSETDKRSHGMEIDFYNRCLKARNEIVDYMVKEMFDLAIAKARTSSLDRVLLSTAWFNDWYDHPYKWANTSIAYFDYKKIDDCAHRLGFEFLREESQPMIEKYRAGDKKEFYTKLIDRIPPALIFEKIISYYVKLLPEIGKREDIFRELEKLYINNHWIGFTALAIIQVEGLFTDMINILAPVGKNDSLPKKAAAIRPYYAFSEENFDYYQYSLPKIRNRLAHTGKVHGEDYWGLAHDFLYDIWDLLNVFSQLKDQVMTLHQIIVRGDITFLVGIGDFNKLFDLVSYLYKKQKKHDKPKNHTFNIETWSLWENFQRTGVWGHNWEDLLDTWLAAIDLSLRETIIIMVSHSTSWPVKPFDYFIGSGKLTDDIKNDILNYVTEWRGDFKENIAALASSINHLNSFNELFVDMPLGIESRIKGANVYYREARKKLNLIERGLGSS